MAGMAMGGDSAASGKWEKREHFKPFTSRHTTKYNNNMIFKWSADLHFKIILKIMFLCDHIYVGILPASAILLLEGVLVSLSLLPSALF